MAIQPPSAQPPPAPAGTTMPPARKSGCAGCSFSCLGCLGVVVLVIALLLGGGYFFLIAQAQAGVPAPASLLVASTPVEVGKNDSGYQPATSGQSLDAGSSVRTGHTGHATIQFPDGTLTRMSPDTTVTIQSAQLNNAGTLKNATLQQKIGRTLSEVQHLAGGATFQVGGHSVSAEVRGTQFEVLVRQNNTNQVKVFDGTVQVSGQTTVTLHAGQQVDADPNGKLGPVLPAASDRNDPFALQAQCQRAVAQGTTPGTAQITVGDPIT
ncbi:MAG TPA: FecR family protein, partial [Pseudonocardiaceae bacterium]|nr:FecR family protein [Pseudonocardiaceae bacterium]